MLGLALASVVVGATIGVVARCALPVATPDSTISAITIGIAGALAGGFVGFLLLGADVTDPRFRPMQFGSLALGAGVALLSSWLEQRSRQVGRLDPLVRPRGQNRDR